MKNSTKTIGRLVFLGMMMFLTVPVSLGRADERIPLRQFTRLDNVAFDRYCLRLARAYIQSDDRFLCFEAEEASELEFQGPDKKAVADDSVSGRYCVEFVKEMRFNFKVNKAGKYQAWYRAYFPAAGSWNHYEQMDISDSMMVQDSEFGPVKVWLWVKGPVYDLTRGRHSYIYPSPTAWCGGARLDKVVLAREGAYQPEGLGPPSSKLTTSQEGVAVTKRIRLIDVEGWGLTWEEKRENGGTILVEYAASEEGPWKPADLERGPVFHRCRGDELWLRVQIHGKEGAASPQLRGLTVMLSKPDTEAPLIKR